MPGAEAMAPPQPAMLDVNVIAREKKGVVAVPKVQAGLGVAVVSTSQGVVVDRQARKLQVGGEVLCEVW